MTLSFPSFKFLCQKCDEQTGVFFNPFNTNPTKWSNTLKQIRRQQPTNCLSVFDHFVGPALKGLKYISIYLYIRKFPMNCLKKFL